MSNGQMREIEQCTSRGKMHPRILIDTPSINRTQFRYESSQLLLRIGNLGCSVHYLR